MRRATKVADPLPSDSATGDYSRPSKEAVANALQSQSVRDAYGLGGLRYPAGYRATGISVLERLCTSFCQNELKSFLGPRAYSSTSG